ncbi:RTA1 domain protein [Aspergillus luchuensis]|uniref:RTA1 domain protein n=1 Tax=Aspergillus kawachii TaxID=1069201 RepID=A0A146F5B6_ASPKA|nr:RTA1 domain protein [Aspergillus luchuensis]
MASEYRLYEYTPSTAAAITATACFGLITICHLIHYFAQRKWFFTPFIIGANVHTRRSGRAVDTVIINLVIVAVFLPGASCLGIVEFAQGRTGVLQRKEVWMYVFDGLLMVLVMVVLLVWHPSRLGNSHGKEEGVESSED